ncbi:MAG: aminotransferase class V-fold PLP-dependent enzyme, partial [Alphaproteobacteria bacterium]|nr:aminotransferase class V-fold PLP-dependent enzyme [Alphaproteobacteria bacterium]
MSLAAGTHYLAIPGPSVIPDAVLRAMHRPAPNIYTGELHEVVDSLIPDLKRVARTEHNVAIYIANGHGAWEAAISNTLSRGDLVLSLATGVFAHGWADMAEVMGVRTERLDFGKRSPIDLARVEAALAADPEHEIKAVMAVQVDTSTSVRNDIAGLRAVLDRAAHPALLMVDCIACLACDPFEMDAWGVDVMVTGSQKGLMTPPGLGFVFYNEKADQARERADLVTRYWDWRPRVEAEEFYRYFCGTAPTHHLFGLRAALDLIADEGLENVWARHALLARAIWAAVDAWGASGPLELNVREPELRSRAVTALRIGAPHGREIRDWVSAKAGVTLGIGLGMASPEDPTSDGFFRIGHMGHVNAQMVMGALGAI